MCYTTWNAYKWIHSALEKIPNSSFFSFSFGISVYSYCRDLFKKAEQNKPRILFPHFLMEIIKKNEAEIKC